MTLGLETKVFDPADGFAPLTNVIELTDSTLARRGDRWWMFLAGEAVGHEGIRLFSASLPAGAPLAAPLRNDIRRDRGHR